METAVPAGRAAARYAAAAPDGIRGRSPGFRSRGAIGRPGKFSPLHPWHGDWI